MNRYIDAGREIIVKEYHNEKGLITRREIGEELVRCKNCMHNGSFDTDCPFGWRDERFNLPDDMDYCSYGEKKHEQTYQKEKTQTMA